MMTANPEPKDNAENPYRVLDAAENPRVFKANDVGRLVRALRIMSLIVAMFALLVCIACFYEIWISYDSPPPWNSDRWRVHYIRVAIWAGLDFCSAVVSAYLLPRQKWRGLFLFGVSVLLLVVMLGIDF